MKTSTYALYKKILAYFLLVIAVCLAAVCVLGAITLVEGEFYTNSPADLYEAFVSPHATPRERGFIQEAISLGYALRYWVYVIGGVSLLLAAACFVYLLCAAGHRGGAEEIRPGWLTPIPLDLLTVLVVLLSCFVVFIGSEINGVAVVALVAAGFALAVVVFTAYCMDFAIRAKLGGWWRNTVICWLLRLLGKLGRFLWRSLGTLLRNMPLVWRTVVLLAVLGLLGLIFAASHAYVLVVLEYLAICAGVLYLALVLRKLQRGGKALAAGDLSYQVDTGKMLWDFKAHGEDLNSIALGMTRAVDDRVKSERLKTELITNVSHDIKTPLTSIINYADLISREETGNATVTEYAGVLLRQSERLKKLLEDLVEASKASTGNLDILLAPCEVGVLLTQTAGEYEQRLRDNGLELVVRQPETPVRVMADGRRLWRVFDNLMNNVCKYAQSGTRVYLSVEEQEGEAVISFKNTSRYALDTTAEELMERFVRGDRSRGTEGSGLGLSIAQSLTQLQSGKLSLTVDGDLFKAVLRFKSI